MNLQAKSVPQTEPKLLCRTTAAPSASAIPEQHTQGLGSHQGLASTPSKGFCSLPFACPGKLSCISDFESTLLFSQHFNCTGETGQGAGPAAQPKTAGVGLGSVPAVPVSPGEQITCMSSDTDVQ